VLKLKLS